jgi:hypothetical protein
LFLTQELSHLKLGLRAPRGRWPAVLMQCCVWLAGVPFLWALLSGCAGRGAAQAQSLLHAASWNRPLRALQGPHTPACHHLCLAENILEPGRKEKSQVPVPQINFRQALDAEWLCPFLSLITVYISGRSSRPYIIS